MLEYTMEAGTYFVGDLFNILHNQWDDVYDSTGTYIEGKAFYQTEPSIFFLTPKNHMAFSKIKWVIDMTLIPALLVS